MSAYRGISVLRRISRQVRKVPMADSCTAANGSAIASGMIFTVIDDPGYRMSPGFSRRAFVEPNETSDVLFRE